MSKLEKNERDISNDQNMQSPGIKDRQKDGQTKHFKEKSFVDAVCNYCLDLECVYINIFIS